MVISVGEIEARLRERAEGLSRALLPAARREGNTLAVGSIDGEAGQSLRIEILGARQGKWRDYGGTEHGDMLDLIRLTQRLADMGSAVAWAKEYLGIDDGFRSDRPRASEADKRRAADEARGRAERRQRQEEQERAAKMKGAKALFLKGRAIGDTPAAAYLQNRLLDGGEAWPGSLRYFGETYNREHGGKMPAMLACIVNAEGRHLATHRTYLVRDGGDWRKLNSPNAKMVIGPMGGGFVPINKGASGKSMRQMPGDEPVYVTEGIEDAIVVRMKLPQARIVAAVNVGNIGMIVLPSQARKLVIVADRDDKPEAVDALERAIARQQARGIEVEICMPPVGVKDVNDWLQQGSSQSATLSRGFA